MTLGTGPRQRLTLAVACMAQGMMVLDVLIVSVALPAMQRELHLLPAGLEWVVSGYALALAALIPTGGALGDHFGRKRFFVSGVTLFTLASVGCALSVSGAMLIGFRVIQGIGGAVMSSLTLSLIFEAYPPEARTGPIGLWAAVSGLAVAGGSVLGGLLLSVFPWSSIFWVNVPIGVVTVVIGLVAVTESRDPVPRSFDLAGVALSASGLLLLTFGFVDASGAGWHSPVPAVCVAGGVGVLVAFVAWERRAAAPMVPPALLRTPGFGWACAVYLLAYLAFSGFIYYVTLFFQNIEEWSALRTGLSWLFFCIPYFIVAQLGKRLARWLPVAWAVGSGCLIAAAGMLGMSRLTTTTPFAWPAACYIVVGAGFGLMVPAGSSAAMAEVPAGSSGIGSALFNSCRQIGTAMGLAILGSIAASAIVADWHRRTGSLRPAGRQPAAQLGADVAGGQAHLVAASAGQDLLYPAVASFLQGFELALLLAGVILAAAGAAGFWGLRHLQMPGSSRSPTTNTNANRRTWYRPANRSRKVS
jgi:MFS transporter, DHA2 family, methylenomycin A resistance protein